MTESPDVRIDTTTPHSARIWNYWLGGKDNYAVDREAGDAWVAVSPGIIEVARAARGFLRRAVRHLAADQGIRQFLDVGTGLPTADNTHEVAQRAAPDARIVYVDNDPLVLAHARALLTSTPEGATRYLHADMHDSAALIESAAELLDFDQPVAIMFMGVLGHVQDNDTARALVSGLVDHARSGSYLVLCDSSHEESDVAAQRAKEQYAETGAVPYRNRTLDELQSFFTGLEWVEPGFVSAPLWRPERPDLPRIHDNPPAPVDMYGGVGLKP